MPARPLESFGVSGDVVTGPVPRGVPARDVRTHPVTTLARTPSLAASMSPSRSPPHVPTVETPAKTLVSFSSSLSPRLKGSLSVIGLGSIDDRGCHLLWLVLLGYSSFWLDFCCPKAPTALQSADVMRKLHRSAHRFSNLLFEITYRWSPSYVKWKLLVLQQAKIRHISGLDGSPLQVAMHNWALPLNSLACKL